MTARVVMVGRLRPALVAALRQQYAAPELEELDPQAAAG
jgi:hypothetical protein